MSQSEIDAQHFVRSVSPLIEKRDLQALSEHLKRNWTGDQLASLLSHPDQDVRKVAAVALSLVGCKRCIPMLARRLRDPDPCTNQLVEHALWSIWFRCGTPDANHHLARGALAIKRQDLPHAMEHINKAIHACPDCAEAYNQRAIVHFLKEDYVSALKDCRRTVAQMPCHFGAWAGMGHCYAHLGRLEKALECYEKALSVNPHMREVREAVRDIRRRLNLRPRREWTLSDSTLHGDAFRFDSDVPQDRPPAM